MDSDERRHKPTCDVQTLQEKIDKNQTVQHKILLFLLLLFLLHVPPPPPLLPESRSWLLVFLMCSGSNPNPAARVMMERGFWLAISMDASQEGDNPHPHPRPHQVTLQPVLWCQCGGEWMFDPDVSRHLSLSGERTNAGEWRRRTSSD